MSCCLHKCLHDGLPGLFFYISALWPNFPRSKLISTSLHVFPFQNDGWGEEVSETHSHRCQSLREAAMQVPESYLFIYGVINVYKKPLIALSLMIYEFCEGWGLWGVHCCKTPVYSWRWSTAAWGNMIDEECNDELLVWKENPKGTRVVAPGPSSAVSFFLQKLVSQKMKGKLRSLTWSHPWQLSLCCWEQQA